MRLAIRALWRRPVFSLAAILTIALGVGANTALFSVIHAVLIQPLPFRDPARLVQIWETHPALPQLQVTVPDFEDFRRRCGSFEQMAAYTLSAMNTTTLLGQGEPETVHATMAGSEFFETMGIQPLAGRAFSDGEERAKQKVALLSENLWRRKFAADAGVVGRSIRLASDSFLVAGIVPQRQAFPEWADLWIPLSLIEPGLANARKYHPLEVIGRLKPGVKVEQAQNEIQTVARDLAAAHPDTNATAGAFVIPLAREMTGAVRPALLLAWAAVGLVLLLACANVAHLFLARSLERRAEMSIRAALGAGLWQLMRSILAEALLVALAGGGAGIAAAAASLWLVRGLAASQIPRFAAGGLTAPVWLFAAAISLVAVPLFGLPAGWQAIGTRGRITAGGRSVVRGRSRVSAGLVAAEVALALLVLSGVALLGRDFASLAATDPGFRAERVWTIRNLPLRSDPQKAGEFLTTQLLPALERVPGVVAAAAVNTAPMSLAATEHSRFATRFGIQGRRFEAGSYPVAQNRWLTPGYFDVMGIPLTRGRALAESDRNSTRILINETLARRFFPGADPVGRQIIVGVMDPKQTSLEIVGVVGDVRDMGMDQEVEPTLYGISTGPVMTVVVKTAAGAGGFSRALRDAIHRVDSEIPVASIHPLQENVTDSLARRRLALYLLGIFGAMAAFLIAAGIYGLLAQSVGARVREFGVRAAVGAEPGQISGMMLREALWLAAPGIVGGLLLALAFARVMRSFVYRMSPADPLSMATAAAFVLAITCAAAWLPARRAAAVDPAAALRSE